MKNSKASRTSRQSQGRRAGARGTQGRRSSASDSDSRYSSEYESSRFAGGRQGRDSSERMYDEDGRFSSDDGGYYSYRNFGNRGRSFEDEGRGAYRDDSERIGRRSQSERYAPYRSSEQNYESGSRWDNDGYGESRWNRPGEDRNRNDRDDRSYRDDRSSQSERGSRWGREDLGWGGRMSGRDQEMGYNTDMTDEDNYGDFEGISGGRSARYADVDDVEGQYDEDYRDRDSYSRRQRGISGSRSSSGHRR